MNSRPSLGRMISCIYRYTQTYLSKELMEYGLGSGQFSFLLLLQHKEGVSQDHIAHTLHVDKATTTRAFKKLEKEGYITRKRDPEDRRRYNIYLTEKGRTIYPVLLNISSVWTDILLKDFSDEEKDLFFGLLARVMEHAITCRRSVHD
jgi:DNA-binding MarR family transcriptional regulator